MAGTPLPPGSIVKPHGAHPGGSRPGLIPPVILVRGGLLAEGGLVRSDLRVVGDRITETGPDLPVDGADVVDADGLVVLPGFVDAHSHGDAAVLDPDVQAALTHQGVTTVVLGQD